MADAARLAELISEDFYGNCLDFTARKTTAGDAWSRLPEVKAVAHLSESGVSSREVRFFLTFVAAMDRMRDSTALWRAASELFRTNPKIFDPETVSEMEHEKLEILLRGARVSRFPVDDTRAWRTIATTLAVGYGPVCQVVAAGEGDATELLRDVRSCDTRSRARFPLLRGEKISLMWIRLMAEPGGARIRNLDAVPVAVDVQVRRVTENLGVTEPRSSKLTGEIKKNIQDAWGDAVAAANVPGPERITGTCCALDPALWFFGKHGCSHCERVKRRVRFGRACDSCQILFSPPLGQRVAKLVQLAGLSARLTRLRPTIQALREILRRLSPPR